MESRKSWTQRERARGRGEIDREEAARQTDRANDKSSEDEAKKKARVTTGDRAGLSGKEERCPVRGARSSWRRRLGGEE